MWHHDLHSLPTGLGSRCACLTNGASFHRQLQTFLCCNLSKISLTEAPKKFWVYLESVWVRALLHLSIRFEVLLATPERCEVETPTFARVVIALELEASHASHSSERNVFWSALLMYVEDDHKTQHPLVNPTRLLKRLRVFCFKATISYCFAIEALSPEQGGILQSWWHVADVCQFESEQ